MSYIKTLDKTVERFLVHSFGCNPEDDDVSDEFGVYFMNDAFEKLAAFMQDIYTKANGRTERHTDCCL